MSAVRKHRLLNDIGKFFKQKIVNLREQFPAKVRYQSTSSAVPTIGDCIFQTFKDITVTDVSKFIKEIQSHVLWTPYPPRW